MAFMIFLGIQEASAALIGQKVGAVNILVAHRYVKTIFFLGIGVAVTVSALLLIF